MIYEYLDSDGLHEITDEQIIAEYWDYWCERMRSVGKEAEISEAKCIEDWCLIHMGWPKK